MIGLKRCVFAFSSKPKSKRLAALLVGVIASGITGVALLSAGTLTPRTFLPMTVVQSQPGGLPVVTATATGTSAPDMTSSAVPAATASATGTPTTTPFPTGTATATATATALPSATGTATTVPSPTATATPSPTATETPVVWVEEGRWGGGPAHRALAAGDTTYFSSGSQIEILNTAGSSIAVQAATAFTSTVADLAYQPNRLYLAAERAGLIILDVSSPTAPSKLGQLAFSDSASRVAVSGSYAYVTVENIGLRIVDVSTPTAPLDIGGVSIAASFSSIAQSGSAVYLGTRTGQLYVANVASPSAPVASTWSGTGVTGTVWGLQVAAGRLYIVQGSSLVIADISSPLAPVKRGTYAAPDSGTLRSVSVDATTGRAYLGREKNPSGYSLMLLHRRAPRSSRAREVEVVRDGIRALASSAGTSTRPTREAGCYTCST